MDNNLELVAEIFKDKEEISGLTVGNSMLPIFRNNKDIAVIKKITTPLKVNDVLLYKKRGTADQYVLHRLIRITKDGYIIRGDNNHFNETRVTNNDIIGVLKGFYRNKRYYDCTKSVPYKLYVIFIRLSYPIRHFIFRVVRKMKRIIGPH